MRANYKMQRLYIDASLNADCVVSLSKEHAHYLTHVLRMKEGGELLLFNGRDGEWLAEIIETAKKSASVLLKKQERPQSPAPDIIYCFAPLKHARLDYMVQKAVEMGAGSLQPVITQYTQASRVNLERMTANTIEAAEQCGILAVPACHNPLSFEKFLESWDQARQLIFCDEAAEGDNPLEILAGLKKGPLGVIIGPEGGFSDKERARLHSLPFVTAIPLGPRILRADTAAIAALAVVGATLGDWG